MKNSNETIHRSLQKIDDIDSRVRELQTKKRAEECQLIDTLVINGYSDYFNLNYRKLYRDFKLEGEKLGSKV